MRLNRNVILVAILIIISLADLNAQKRVSVGKTGIDRSKKVKLSGVIKDFSTGETLIGSTVFIESEGIGVGTSLEGSYEIELLPNDYIIKYSMIGYESIEFYVSLYGPGKHNVRLYPSATQLDEIQVTGQSPDHNVKSNDIGKQVLSIESIQELPSFIGEVDVLKSLTLLPGVSTVGEASSGFNIRGGSTDQNLILLGGAPLFNPSHLFGFFSAFNADAISNVSLYKSGTPAKFGGRGSSVLDIRYKDGDQNNWKGKVSLGTISAKALLEGPIIKNKLLLLVSGRTSYSDWILKAVNDPTVSNSSAYFYDTNARLNYIVNDKNKISYTFYLSGDRFQFSSDTTLSWSNQNHILDWNYSNGEKLSSQVSFISANYENLIDNKTSFDPFELSSSVRNTSAKVDMDYELAKDYLLNFGLQSTLTQINPGDFDSIGEDNSIDSKEVESEKALESSVYADLNLNLREKLGVTVGARYNYYIFLGSKTVNQYEPYIPKSEETIVSSTSYASNELIEDYYGFEPRVTLRYSLSSSASIKAAYNKMYQYIHLISNTSAIAPTDIWKLSDSNQKPQEVIQYSLGYFKNFNDNKIEASLETYYKQSDNLVEYKDGAQLILNEQIETELLTGIGRAYGVELYVKKKTGDLTGWLSYTYSRSLMRVEGAYDVEQINGGDWYSSNFDKPHNLTLVSIYNINPKWSISGNFTYSTGRPVTYPSAKLFLEGIDFAYFDERNGARVPDYHRLDFSIAYKSSNHKKLLGGEWKFSVYNVYGRKNAFSVFFQDAEGAPPQPYKLSVLGVPFPSLTYSFKF